MCSLSCSSGQMKEVCDGVREYFDAMLGAQLLYKFERPQYADVSHWTYAFQNCHSARVHKQGWLGLVSVSLHLSALTCFPGRHFDYVWYSFGGKSVPFQAFLGGANEDIGGLCLPGALWPQTWQGRTCNPQCVCMTCRCWRLIQTLRWLRSMAWSTSSDCLVGYVSLSNNY